ncbi:MAG TPA: hypothetical protein VJ063_19310, partial [Verrucomicrobiae bacterium]|nr:hypothetical protein [Verrucomicrobiae bacterium]
MSMSANTAFGFVILGAAVGVCGLGPSARWKQALLRGAAYAVLALALLTVSQHLFGWDIGIDRLLVAEPLRPARMSPITAGSFALLAAAIILFAHGKAPRTARFINGLVGTVAFFALFGYFYNVPAWYEIEPHAPTTLQTAISFMLLVLACMFAVPEQGLMAIISSDTYAGGLARRVLPAVLILPFAVGWLALLGQERGLYMPRIGDAIAAMILIVFFFSLMVFQAKKLYRSELARRRVESQLRDSRDELVRVNHDLERKVLERTARLQETVA